MSTPKTLQLPENVEATQIQTARGSFAAHITRPAEPKGQVLLIPGWTGSKEDFTPFVSLLGSSGYAATAYDQRGQFETAGDLDDDYSLGGLADDAVAIAAASTSGSTHLLGHSFGGLVAQEAAIRATATWASLSLLSTGPGALGESESRPLAKLIDLLQSQPMAQVYAVREQLRAPSPKLPAEIDEFLQRRFVSNSAASLSAMTQHLLDAPDRVEQVSATGLAFWVGRGADDDAWPSQAQDDMARRLGTTVHVVPDSAHSPAVENPEGLLQAWLPFVESLARSGAAPS